MNKILLGYTTRGAAVTDADAKRLTHLHTAFGKLSPDGKIHTEQLDMRAEMARLRRANPDLRICLSLVHGAPESFSTVCASPALRQAFAESCARVIEEEGYDGVDLDWEYPCVPSNGLTASPDDRENFTLTLREIRRRLDAFQGERKLLSIAAGADVYYPACVDLKAITPCLDYICLMTYDLKCGFHALSGHHTALYSATGDYFRNSCDQALRLFHASGVPKERLLLGAAFYSRKWTGLQDVNHGYLQWTREGGAYGPEWSDLEENYLDKNGYRYYWDDEAKAPYLFDGSTFLSFDDPRSLKEKCAYVLREGYGGLFYWEHPQDRSGRLLRVIRDALDEA